MVQKPEELHETSETSAAPYSDMSCVVVSLVSTSLAWSDQTVHWLRPLQLLADTYNYGFHHYACCYIYAHPPFSLKVILKSTPTQPKFPGVGVFLRGYGMNKLIDCIIHHAIILNPLSPNSKLVCVRLCACVCATNVYVYLVRMYVCVSVWDGMRCVWEQMGVCALTECVCACVCVWVVCVCMCLRMSIAHIYTHTHASNFSTVNGV